MLANNITAVSNDTIQNNGSRWEKYIIGMEMSSHLMYLDIILNIQEQETSNIHMLNGLDYTLIIVLSPS